MTYLWLIVIIVTGITEAVTSAIVSIWFTVGAIFAFLASLIYIDPVWQFMIFIVVSILALIISKPLVKKKLLTRKVPTNADRVIGKIAVVTEKIDNISATGQVKVDKMIWSAKSKNGEIIDEGCTVMVSEIKGVNLIVKNKEEVKCQK
ncbi:MAG: NfeD family protein [Clostridia bacterium]|nr:NfeD family protein [Clostridia bacterium]